MLSIGAGVALLSAVSMTVCGSIRVATAQGSARASSAETASSYVPTVATSLPVFYDRALTAQGFSDPLVKARIAGHIHRRYWRERQRIGEMVCRRCGNPKCK